MSLLDVGVRWTKATRSIELSASLQISILLITSKHNEHGILDILASLPHPLDAASAILGVVKTQKELDEEEQRAR